MARPTKRTCLACLTKARLFELDRAFELSTPRAQPKASFVDGLAHSKSASFAKLLEALTSAELKHICRVHELATSGSKATLQARLRGDEGPKAEPRAPKSATGQSEMFAEPDEQMDDELAAFLLRSQPTVQGILPRLTPLAVSAILRRLREKHDVQLDLDGIDPNPESLARALGEVCPLPVLLSELSREQLDRVCQHYGLTAAETSREGYVRAILAAAAGITEQEASAIEDAAAKDEATKKPLEPAPAAEPTVDEPPVDAPSPHAPAPSLTEGEAQYREALAALPRGLTKRVEMGARGTDLPSIGELVRVRHRQYLVTGVVAPESLSPSTAGGVRPTHLVKLVCLDDDAQGRELEVLWGLELGAQRIDPTRQGLGEIKKFDPVGKFAAYYRALQWNCVTTATRTEEERVQAPFRAGIAVMQHQLVPLLKALALPRANLFIADDVGLGKTIEAGLIMQELLLRQRLEMLLIICPASICLQWQGEMERRFGLRFEIVNREFMARVRKDRGFVTNPWTCGRRFIVSYQTIRRPEYREGLLQALGDRLPKSMLILDEAHTVAPASPGQYAVDSQLTKLTRSIAPRFENRLFLSATPHNGHSNSFSALLELLDPIRFTRGVPVQGRDALDAVMVRRLKRDLIGSSTLKFPTRKVIELQIERDGEQWTIARAVAGDESGTGVPTVLSKSESRELELSELLREYTDLCAPTTKRDRMVFIGLQKRLLSSVAAFSHTLRVHMERSGQKILAALDEADRANSTFQADAPADETHGEEFDADLERAVLGGSREPLPEDATQRQQAEALLSQMQELTRGARRRPTGKLLALMHWVREHQCPSAGKQWLGRASKTSDKWSDTRLIIFTEYAHTASYILDMLRAGVDGSDRDHERIAYFHGAMSDDQRRELQANFNAPLDKHPVRILVATDAAREGVNLQAHCADLIHYDIPWNPGRLEQRNGRIDRTLQSAAEVRCMYFRYPQRREDRVLAVLVEKVDRITRELGSLSAVVLERMEEALEPHGIDADARQRLLLASEGGGSAKDSAAREVESVRTSTEALKEEIEIAANCYERSREFFAPDAEALRDAVSIALGMAGAEGGGRFEPVNDDADSHVQDSQHYKVPVMPDDWHKTLDTLRPPRPKDVAPWDWRRDAPIKSVVFEPLTRMTDEIVQLHLEHPFVKRALSRFTALGFGAHALSRATLVRYAGTHERVVLVGRLSLFGRGASRLHDSLVYLVAELRDGGVRRLASKQAQDKTLLEMRVALHRRSDEWEPAEAFVTRRLDQLDEHVRTLWPQLEARAQDEAEELVHLLDDRGAREAEALTEILDSQKAAISQALDRGVEEDQADGHVETRQRRLDRQNMTERLESLERELEVEPERLRKHYEVLSTRIEAVGMLYLVPATR